MKTKPYLKLGGEDGNAFAILARAAQAARRAGWSQDDIDAVVKEATSSDYNHLLMTMTKNFDCDA
jgi:3-oxoacyl-[acyl-carrier-protein] synthase III